MRQAPRLRAALVIAAAATWVTLDPPPSRAATACYDVSCSTACTPTAPIDIATLVAPGDFPSGHTTPIAFVDPGDGRGRWLIATQEGSILVWDGGTRTILPTPFLDLREEVGGPVEFGGERGLLALAVDPEYSANGQLYVFYTRRDLGTGTRGDIVIARYTRSAANPDLADPASATTILVIDHPVGNHNGGWLAFGPNDGFLYISTGDGGGSCDGNEGINGDGQRTDTLNGKILRIDVRGIDPAGGPPDDCGVGTGNYTVPSSNPFFGHEAACDEVWALGLRNPFRFSFDRATGDLWVGDVGQNRWEEINLQAAATPAPVNWGWPCREGCETSANDDSGCSTEGCPVDGGVEGVGEFPRATGFWDPPLCHRNPGWRSIMGGYRYRGSQVPSLTGAYLYGDPACGQIWRTTTLDPANPAAIVAQCFSSGRHGVYGFAEDHAGELYIVRGGASRIECIHNGEGCFWAGSETFLDGFESGDTSAWSRTVPP
ncbi:MAG TPA: PQQ-dependent sugar dehydrogenase [Thermoanaerobaculia bacterium]|nr:PQQ-dependent sugar dehydrogenase [Thermoanaerobaculia bacterium]